MLAFSVLSQIIILSLFCVKPNYGQSPEEPKYCPEFCECDLFAGLNRADCSTQRLISPYVELPKAVQILDLSYNDVTVLDNNCFQSFAYLQNLTLSHNSLHTIYLDAFSPLHRIQHIDLSHNRLEYVDDRIVESNRRLASLNLAANKFMSLQNKPLLRSSSLRSLNLSNSQINYIYMDLFLALPNLRHLDLSQNLMITLNMAAFSPLQHLESVNLNANRWHCDHGLLRPLELLQKRGILIELLECGTKFYRKDVGTKAAAAAAAEKTTATAVADKSSKMFERLEMFVGSTMEHGFVAPTRQSTEEEKEVTKEAEVERTNIGNIWRRLQDDGYDEDDDDDDAGDNNNYNEQNVRLDGVPVGAQRKNLRILYPSDVEQCDDSWHKMCHKYRQCLNNVSALLLKGDAGVASEKKSRGCYTSNDLNFVFLIGISLGITFVVCIMSCALCMKRCCDARRKQRTSNDNIDYPPAYAPTAPMVTLERPPPATQQQRQRISRRRAPAAPTTTTSTQYSSQSNALIRRDYATRQSRDNFLSRLFGRPARHQYYRTINQNTATLIRRLSRSNLFSNRLSQHFSEESRQQGHVDGDDDERQCSPTTGDLDHSNRTRNSISGHQAAAGAEAASSAEEEERFYEEIFMGNQAVETPEPIITPPRNATDRPETPPPAYREVVVDLGEEGGRGEGGGRK